MTAGFVRHGYRPVFAVEHNLHAAATYAANYGEGHTHWGDIAEVPDTDISVTRFRNVSIIILLK